MTSFARSLGTAAFSSGMGRSAMRSAATAQLSSTLSSVGSASIAWADYNWPLASGPGALLHVDLAELREKRGAAMHHHVRSTYWWWLFTCCVCVVNIITTCAMAGAAASASSGYAGINVLFALLWALAVTSLGLAFFYKVRAVGLVMGRTPAHALLHS